MGFHPAVFLVSFALLTTVVGSFPFEHDIGVAADPTSTQNGVARGFAAAATPQLAAQSVRSGEGTAPPSHEPIWTREATPRPLTLSAGASASPNPSDVGVTIAFTGSSTGGSGPFSYSWSFGDGMGSTNQSDVHNYSTAGLFLATFTVTNSTSVSARANVSLRVHPDPVASILTGAVSTDAGSPVALRAAVSGGTGPFNWTWQFGDGTSATGNVTSHVFASAGVYSVAVGVVDALGVFNFSEVYVSVAPALTAAAVASTLLTEVGATVRFTSSMNGGSPPYEYGWRFGDGTTGTGLFVAHRFAAVGTYVVTFTGTDSTGTSVVQNNTVTVVLATVAGVEALPASTDPNVGVRFFSQIIGGVPPFLVTWSFGDGSVEQGANVTHVYASPGSYNVSTTVTDGVGLSTTGVAIETVQPNLTAALEAHPAQPQVGVDVTLSLRLSGGTPPVSVLWDFGTGIRQSGSTAESHLFATAGDFLVSATVTDAVGGVAVAQAWVNVTAVPSTSPLAAVGGPSALLIEAGLGLTVAVVASVQLRRDQLGARRTR